MPSHFIEYVLLLCAALRLVVGLNRKTEQAPFCLQFLFLYPLLVADVSHLGGVNLFHKGGASRPRGHCLFMYQIYFLLPWPPWIHIAFIMRGVMKIEIIWQSPTCIVRLGCSVKVSSLHCSGLYPHFQNSDRNVLLNKTFKAYDVKMVSKRPCLRNGNVSN